MALARMFLVLFDAAVVFQTQVIGFSFQGSRIIDLEYNDPNFIHEASSWAIIANTGNPSNQIHSICAKTYFLGGNAALLSWDSIFMRIYTELPPHNMIYFSFYVSVFDGWEMAAPFGFFFEKSAIPVILSIDDTRLINENDCQASSLDALKKINIYGRVKHTDSSLHLKIQPLSQRNLLQKVFGFRDLILRFRNISQIDELPENELYIRADNPDFPNNCDCPLGQYKTPEGSCQLCHTLCKTCFGSSSSECFECKDQILFDGNECRTCHESCATCFGPSENECSTCFNGYYVFEGSSCIPTCDSPFIATTIGTTKYCSFPCPSDRFLYPNGECRMSCDVEYNSITWSNKKFCSYYCSHQEEYYIPASDTCLLNCGPGYYKNTTARYCVACQDNFCSSCPTSNGTLCQECRIGAILDLNGICKECQSLLVTYVQSFDTGHRYTIKILPETCDLDATVIQNALNIKPDSKTLGFPSFSFSIISSRGSEYILDLILKESVLEETKLGITLYHLDGLLIVPKKIVPTKGLQEVSKYAPITKTILTTVLAISFGGSLILGSTAAIWSIISFQQFVGYFIYINIELPYQVKIFLSLLSFSTWDFLPNPINTLTQPLLEAILKTHEYDKIEQIPQKFIENGMSTSFIENAGGIILVNFSLLMLLFCIFVLRKQKILKNKIIKTLKRLLRWNFVTRTYLTSAIPLMLAVFLQLYSLNFDQIYFLISSILSIVSLIYLTSFLMLIIRYLHKQSISELKKERSVKLYGTLWEGIILESSYSKYYHIIILLRGILLIFLIVFFENIPLLQLVPLIAFNTGLIFYLFKEATFEDRYLNIVNRVREILILIGEMFIVGLYFKGGSEQHYNHLGWLIVASLLSALFTETIYLIVKQIMNFKKIASQIVCYWDLLVEWFRNKSKKQKYKKTIARQGSPLRDQQNLMIMELGEIEQNEDIMFQ